MMPCLTDLKWSRKSVKHNSTLRVDKANPSFIICRYPTGRCLADYEIRAKDHKLFAWEVAGILLC